MVSDVPSILTARERELMVLLVQGFSQAEIARRVRRSHNTVSQQLAVVRAKLGARTLSQAAYRFAMLEAERMVAERV